MLLRWRFVLSLLCGAPLAAGCSSGPSAPGSVRDSDSSVGSGGAAFEAGDMGAVEAGEAGGVTEAGQSEAGSPSIGGSNADAGPDARGNDGGQGAGTASNVRLEIFASGATVRAGTYALVHPSFSLTRSCVGDVCIVGSF